MKTRFLLAFVLMVSGVLADDFDTLETNEYADLEEREAGSGDAVSKFEERGYVTDEEIEDQENVDDFEERGLAEEKVEEEQEEEQEERELGDEEYINAQDIQQADVNNEEEEIQRGLADELKERDKRVPAPGRMPNDRRIEYMVTGLAYRTYGCYCGRRGKGKPVDAIDRCCKERASCVMEARAAQRKNKKKARGQSCRFYSRCKGIPGKAQCTCQGTGEGCGLELCRCELKNAECIKKNIQSFDKKKTDMRSRC